MTDRFTFRVWHKGKQYMYNNAAIGVGKNKVGYKISGKKRYSWEETELIVVQQCTGYRDTKDTRIFEGDIVEFGKSKRTKGVVVWDEYRYMFNMQDEKKLNDKFGNWNRISYSKVIGNIYENPELLEDN